MKQDKSEFGTKRTCLTGRGVSAPEGRTDVRQPSRDFRF